MCVQVMRLFAKFYDAPTHVYTVLVRCTGFDVLRMKCRKIWGEMQKSHPDQIKTYTDKQYLDKPHTNRSESNENKRISATCVRN